MQNGHVVLMGVGALGLGAGIYWWGIPAYRKWKVQKAAVPAIAAPSADMAQPNARVEMRGGIPIPTSTGATQPGDNPNGAAKGASGNAPTARTGLTPTAAARQASAQAKAGLAPAAIAAAASGQRAIDAAKFLTDQLSGKVGSTQTAQAAKAKTLEDTRKAAASVDVARTQATLFMNNVDANAGHFIRGL